MNFKFKTVIHNLKSKFKHEFVSDKKQLYFCNIMKNKYNVYENIGFLNYGCSIKKYLFYNRKEDQDEEFKGSFKNGTMNGLKIWKYNNISSQKDTYNNISSHKNTYNNISSHKNTYNNVSSHKNTYNNISSHKDTYNKYYYALFNNNIFNQKKLYIFFMAICLALNKFLNTQEENNENNNSLKKKKKKKIMNSHFFGLSNETASCCGIMAYMGNRDASKILIDGIEILQNRGYDSCGMSTISNKNVLKTTKYASNTTCDAIEKLKSNYLNSHKNDHIGIAHTRWATHGCKTDENAHPHVDYGERISIVHNGIIENYREIKTFLLKNNIPFKSNTDTEVVANLIGYFLDKKQSFQDAVLSAITQLEGTWSFCIIHKNHPDEMVLASNGSPLHIGFKDDEIFIASEHTALFMFTNEYISLKNGEILSISKDKINDLKLLKKVENIPEIAIQKTPHPYPHWTIKEIHEQSATLSKSLNNGGRFSSGDHLVKLGGLDPYIQDLNKIENLVLVGCGTSYYAALFAKYLMNYLNCFNTVQVMDPIDFNISVIPKEKEGVIFISQSGETRDVIKACKLAEDLNVRKLSVVNSVGSTIANMTGRGVYLNAGREVGVASTKCFTSEVSVLTLIALWFFQHKKNNQSSNKATSLINSLHRLPLYTGVTIKSCENTCKTLSEKFKNTKSMLIIGNGLSYPIAQEGALKIKELAYIHCEGFTGASLKHGPYALLGGEDNIPVIMLLFNDNTKNAMINTGEQIKSRGAHIVCLTDDENLVKHFADDIILIPNNGILTPLLAVIPLQMLAYYTSVNKGINPDKPRCLAKTVTVS
ncbi:glutamine-fructose-6-phosphate transaminase (isomerizing) [Plasmodium falciparum NF135/5.C10]|uniref:glutamine--fructose-6-phosphate transaminase (isomerizing) n=2 Tax=Plasmodium falciparum TaxID=5833 RepID=A0A024V669_PLAFA|nr:glutamine-fructose-6-phosphate transaminase (isomerizing) [Plasmodium falciparum Vietnam Oak-Knoll (FVO)]ETW42432.1 glutamine-fructose-6-phosphate transaminase (isomerizing) [Plasmodium falciparum NF135/5.C10]